MFLFHIIWPNKFSILDQHVIRTFIFLKEGKLEKSTDVLIRQDEIQMNNSSLYYRYNEFVHKISKEHNISLRDIDKALMAFGKFLAGPLKNLGKYSCKFQR